MYDVSDCSMGLLRALFSVSAWLAIAPGLDHVLLVIIPFEWKRLLSRINLSRRFITRELELQMLRTVLCYRYTERNGRALGAKDGTIVYASVTVEGSPRRSAHSVWCGIGGCGSADRHLNG